MPLPVLYPWERGWTPGGASGILPRATIEKFGRDVQAWGGFLPLESFAKVEGELRRALGAQEGPYYRGERAGEYDYLLVALFALPFAGTLGKGAAIGTRAISATYRVTPPLTAKTLPAVRAYFRAFLRGDVPEAIAYLGGRMGKLFGREIGAAASTWLTRAVATLPRMGPFTSRYVATRLVLLERLITVTARSVPTQAAWAIQVLTRATVHVSLALFEKTLADVTAVLTPFILPEFLHGKALFDWYWGAYEQERGEIEGFLGKGDEEAVVETAKWDVNAGRKAAEKAGWKGPSSGKMTPAQKKAFREAAKPGGKRKARTTTKGRGLLAHVGATLYPESSPFGMLETEGLA